MKAVVFFSLLSILNLSSFSQIRFENGYFLLNDGKRIDCLIKNLDWKNNPKEFYYKFFKDDITKTANVEDVIEFGVINQSKYKRFDVDIDQSSEDIAWLSKTKAPTFKKDRLFLKVLIEGKASLYLYESTNITRFFMSVDTVKIEQLIFKNYFVTQGIIEQNNTFRNQLWNNLKCDQIEIKNINKLNYAQNELIDLFILYNNCNRFTIVNYDKKKKKGSFNLSIRPGINSSKFFLQNAISNTTVLEFENKLNLRFGAEAEFIIGFNKNKWAIAVEPVFQYYKSEGFANGVKASMDYKSIELLAQIRHYFFLNDNSKIFINGNVIYDFPFNSSIKIENYYSLGINSRLDLSFGLGYKYKKYSCEIRYMSNRGILSDYLYWSSQYKTISLILGYTIL